MSWEQGLFSTSEKDSIPHLFDSTKEFFLGSIFLSCLLTDLSTKKLPRTPWYDVNASTASVSYFGLAEKDIVKKWRRETDTGPLITVHARDRRGVKPWSLKIQVLWVDGIQRWVPQIRSAVMAATPATHRWAWLPVTNKLCPPGPVLEIKGGSFLFFSLWSTRFFLSWNIFTLFLILEFFGWPKWESSFTFWTVSD